jgi:hypothetical protein
MVLRWPLSSSPRMPRKPVLISDALNREASAFPAACGGVSERTQNRPHSLRSKIPCSLLQGASTVHFTCRDANRIGMESRALQLAEPTASRKESGDGPSAV